MSVTHFQHFCLLTHAKPWHQALVYVILPPAVCRKARLGVYHPRSDWGWRLQQNYVVVHSLTSIQEARGKRFQSFTGQLQRHSTRQRRKSNHSFVTEYIKTTASVPYLNKLHQQTLFTLPACSLVTFHSTDRTEPASQLSLSVFSLSLNSTHIWERGYIAQWLRPFLTELMFVREHTSDSSTNYDSFLNWTFSSPNMVRTVRRKKHETLVWNHMRAHWVCSRAENSAMYKRSTATYPLTPAETQRRKSFFDWPVTFTKIRLVMVTNCTLAKCSEEHANHIKLQSRAHLEV